MKVSLKTYLLAIALCSSISMVADVTIVNYAQNANDMGINVNICALAADGSQIGRPKGLAYQESHTIPSAALQQGLQKVGIFDQPTETCTKAIQVQDNCSYTVVQGANGLAIMPPLFGCPSQSQGW